MDYFYTVPIEIEIKVATVEGRFTFSKGEFKWQKLFKKKQNSNFVVSVLYTVFKITMATLQTVWNRDFVCQELRIRDSIITVF